ncbi:hypothetical protein AAVH_19435 [Aphelenchoides avenae]|nr:hypothetical protein AAVH_19435 [Aphelenchus avenae]
MGARADITAFSEAYAAAKLRFRFRDTDAAFASYSQYYTQAKLLGQRPLSPKEFLRELQRLFATAAGTSLGGGRFEYLGNGSAWRGVLRHRERKAVAAGYENIFPSHMEVTEFVYVAQPAE